MAKNSKENTNKMSVAEAYNKYFLPSITSYQNSLEIVEKDFDARKTELYKKQPRKHKGLAIGLELFGSAGAGTGIMFGLSRALEFTVSQAAAVYSGWAALMIAPFVLIEGGVHLARRIKYKKQCKKVDEAFNEYAKKFESQKQELDSLNNLVKDISTNANNDFVKFTTKDLKSLYSNVDNMNKIFLSLLNPFANTSKDFNDLYKRAVEAVNTHKFDTKEYCERLTDLLKTCKTLEYVKQENQSSEIDVNNSVEVLNESLVNKLKKISPFLEVLNSSYNKIYENKTREEEQKKKKLEEETENKAKAEKEEEKEFFTSFGVDTLENI